MADNTNRLAGTATLTVDGRGYALRGNFVYRTSRVTRESITGQDGVHGYKEMPVTGMIGFDLTDANDLSVAAINDMTNVTIVGELANGKTIIGSNMWSVEDQEVETVDAKLSCKFEGFSVIEA